MNGGFIVWGLVTGIVTLASGAPIWAALGFALVAGLVGNIDRRMIRGSQKGQGLSIHPWL